MLQIGKGMVILDYNIMIQPQDDIKCLFLAFTGSLTVLLNYV